MIDVKKIDEKDLIFVNQKLTKEDEIAFSNFLRTRKKKASKISLQAVKTIKKKSA